MKKFLELIRDLVFAFIFQLAPRFANVVLFILLGRLVGANEAGIFTLAATYLLIMSSIMYGLDDLVTRQVAQEPSNAFRYLTNFSLVRIGLTILFYAILIAIVNYFFDYSNETISVILVMGLSLIPDGLTYVAQSVLLGQRYFLGPTIIIATISLLKLAGGILILLDEGNLVQIAWIWLLGSLLSMISMWILGFFKIEGAKRFAPFNTSLISKHWRTASLFIFITALATFETQLDTIILSGFHGENAVAWFGAATTVAYGLILISHAYRYAAYPIMSRYAVQSHEKLDLLYQNSLILMSFIIFPIVAGVAILSSQIIKIIFGSNFIPSISVLQILIFALIFIFLNEPNIRIILVYNRQRMLAIFLLAAVAVNITFNLVLAQAFSADGAAVSRIASSFVFFILTYQYVKRRIIRVNVIRLVAKPLLAAAFMSILLLLIIDWPIPFIVIIGIITYLIVLRLINGWPSFPWQELAMPADSSTGADSSANRMNSVRSGDP